MAGKKILCECGATIVFEGIVPKYHKCGLCGVAITVASKEITTVDLDSTAVGFTRRRRPGAVTD